MIDYLVSIKQLRRDAAEAASIRDLATNKAKREIFDRLQNHLSRLARDVEQAVNGSDTPRK